ncbi:MAG: rhodanese-like domain-containing protein [Marinibacterium sp.]
MTSKPRRDIVRRDLIGLSVIGAALGILTYRALLPADVGPQGRTLTVAEANRLASAGEITLIDIRRPDEWARTGIAAPAHPIDMRRKDFADALRAVAAQNPAAPVALICARGVRSGRLTKKLRAAGFSNIIDVPEGMVGSASGPGWVASSLPLKPYEVPQ